MAIYGFIFAILAIPYRHVFAIDSVYAVRRVIYILWFVSNRQTSTKCFIVLIFIAAVYGVQ